MSEARKVWPPPHDAQRGNVRHAGISWNGWILKPSDCPNDPPAPGRTLFLKADGEIIEVKGDQIVRFSRRP